MLYIGVLVYLVLEFLRPQEFIPAILGWRIVLFAMMLLLPGWLATLTHRKLLRTPEDLFMLLLWLVCMASYVFDPGLVMRVGFPAGEMGKAFLSYIFVAHVIDTRRRLTGALFAMIAMLSIIAYMAGQDVGLQNQYASVGMFNNRNDFANAMALIVPLAFVFLLRGRLSLKMVMVLVIGLAMYKIFRSNSRGGQMAALLGVATILYLTAKTRGGKVAMITVGAVMLALALTLSGHLGTIVKYKEDKSAMGRVVAWDDAMKMFRHHPLFGVGYYRFGVFGERDSHSTFMRALGELGGAGLFVIVGLCFVAFRDAYRLSRHAPSAEIQLLAYGMTGMLAAYVVGSLFMTGLYQNYVHIQFAFVAALRLVADRERIQLASGGSAEPSDAPDEPKPGRAMSLGLLEPPPPVPTPWPASWGPGLAARGIMERGDWAKIFGLTVLCWFTYKLFIIRSF